jgi:TPP-dependent pyruvate/acetoin dehydrogenase alpha subunit
VVAEARLREVGLAMQDELRRSRKQAIQTVEEAVAQVQREPSPDPYIEDWCALASTHLTEGSSTR